MSPQKGKSNDEHKSLFGNRRKSNVPPGGGADWSSVTPELLHRLIGTVTSRGGACRFGYTRDGGAYALGLYYGSESHTEYCRPSESIEAFLEEFIELYSDLPNSNGVSPAQ